MSVGQAARLSGIPRDRVEVIERGETPTPDEWAKLCHLYDVSGFVTPRPDGEARMIVQCKQCYRVWCLGDAPHHERFCSAVCGN